MGNQTYVILQCWSCHLFQAQIDKKSRSFTCAVCHTKQAYARVFAKSNVAKDLRPLVATYNAKGVAAMEAAKEEAPDGEECQVHQDRRHEDFSELDLRHDRTGRIGIEWKEFDEDSRPDEENVQEVEDDYRQAPDLPTSSTHAAVCSAWERDSDARRIEARQARFNKKPRQHRGDVDRLYRRTRPPTVSKVQSNTHEVRWRSNDVEDTWGNASSLPGAMPEKSINSEPYEVAEGQNQNANTAWDAFLSDED